MSDFQARIRPSWCHRFPHLKPYKWYDVEPLWPASHTRMIDMAGKRVARLRTGDDCTSLRAEYLTFRRRPQGATARAS